MAIYIRTLLAWFISLLVYSCYSYTVLFLHTLWLFTGPSALAVNIMKNIEISSIDLQWDAVDDFLPTIYTIIWISERNIFQVATLIEQTSYTITGLTLDTAIIAANMCGSGPEFRVHISFSTDDTSTANTNSSITMTAVMINPTMATTVSTAIATNSTTNPAGTTTANENSKYLITANMII